MTPKNKLSIIALAAVSIDGRLAKNSKHFTDWTSPEDKKFFRGELKKMDVVIVGHNTFKVSKKYLLKRNCIVLSRSVKNLIASVPNLVYLNPQKQNIVEYLKKHKYKKVAVLGGTQVYTYFFDKNLIGELYLTIEPVSFGLGLPLHNSKKINRSARLISVKKLNPRGTILLHYKYYGSKY